MKSRFYLLALTALLSAGAAAQATAQATDKNQFTVMVESKNYIFQAQTALPMRGGVRNLTNEFDLKVTPTAIISDLPYFGRAYVAPTDPAKGPLDFTSTQFTYTTTPRSKGGWVVVIKPQDHKDVQQMTLTISAAGYTTVQVTNLNSDPISFNGVIVAPRKK